MSFLATLMVIAVVSFPAHGAVLYGDPWTWWRKPAPSSGEEE